MNWTVMAVVAALTWLCLALVLRPVTVLRSAWLRRRLRRALQAALALAVVTLPVALSPGAAAPTGGAPVATAETLDPAERLARERPGDVRARLNLARHYLSIGVPSRAIDEYIAALRLDKRNAEAYATLGYLLYLAGRPEDALWAEDRALAADPARADARYFRGVVLLTALGCRAEGLADLRTYLERAPFGAYRAEAAELLAGPHAGPAQRCTTKRPPRGGR